MAGYAEIRATELSEAVADPYWKIKAEIQQELEHVEKVHAVWFSGDSSAAKGLGSELSGLEEQLEALESAVSSMVASPERFGLSRIDAFQRQVEVENLRYQFSDLSRISKQIVADSSSSSSKSFSNIQLGEVSGWQQQNGSLQANGHIHISSKGSSSGGGSGASGITGKGRLPKAPPALGYLTTKAGGGTQQGLRLEPQQRDAEIIEDHMQQQLRDQDEALEEISIHVGRIKHTGQLMHEELNEQDALLGELRDQTETTDSRLRTARRRVQDLIRQTRQDKQLMLIIVLSVVLVILTMLAFA